MTLEEFADLSQLNIEFIRYWDRVQTWTVRFDNTSVVDDPTSCIGSGTDGYGKTIEEATTQCVERVKGKLLATGKGERRRIIKVPMTLTVG